MKLAKMILSFCMVMGALVSHAKETELMSKDFTTELTIDVSLEEAWSLWTDSRKLEKWLTTQANVNPKLGGSYELFWDPTNHNENSTLDCKIMAFVPYKLLSFEWRGPVPYADLMNAKPFPTWVSISFEAITLNQTILHFRHSGWGKGERWKEAWTWQKNAWNDAFSELKKITER